MGSVSRIGAFCSSMRAKALLAGVAFFAPLFSCEEALGQLLRVTVVTSTTSPYSVSANTQLVVFDLTSPGSITVILPNASSFSGCPAIVGSCPVIGIKDLGGTSTPILVTDTDGTRIEMSPPPPPNPSYTQSTPNSEIDYVLAGQSGSTVGWVVK
jgi:hypothetical protein